MPPRSRRPALQNASHGPHWTAGRPQGVAPSLTCARDPRQSPPMRCSPPPRNRGGVNENRGVDTVSGARHFRGGLASSKAAGTRRRASHFRSGERVRKAPVRSSNGGRLGRRGQPDPVAARRSAPRQPDPPVVATPRTPNSPHPAPTRGQQGASASRTVRAPPMGCSPPPRNGGVGECGVAHSH